MEPIAVIAGAVALWYLSRKKPEPAPEPLTPEAEREPEPVQPGLTPDRRVKLPKVRVKVSDEVKTKARQSLARAKEHLPAGTPSFEETFFLAQIVKTKDPALIFVAAGATVAGVGAAPVVAAFYVQNEIYKRLGMGDMHDGFNSLFGKDRLSLVRKAEKSASRARGKNQKEYAEAVAHFIRENQAVSLSMMEDMVHVAGLRDFQHRLNFWRRQMPGIAWLQLPGSVWDDFTWTDDPERQIAAGGKLVEAGLAVFE